MGQCAGEEFAAISGIAILSSYLVLFISFYLATYRKDGKAVSGRKAVRRMSQAPLPDPLAINPAAGKSGAKPDSSSNATTTGAKTNGSTRSRARKA